MRLAGSRSASRLASASICGRSRSKASSTAARTGSSKSTGRRATQRPYRYRRALTTIQASRSGQRPLEVVEAPVPAALVRADGLLVPQAAVAEAHGRRAVGLLEVQLDERPR